MTGYMGRARTRRRYLLLAATVASLVASSLSGTVALGAKAPTSAPNTAITSSPTNPSASTSASFAFSSTKGGSTFTCKLDGGTAGSCTSPKAYSGLATGSHTFSVYATWKGASDGTPATYTWTIDTTVPSTPTGLAATTPTATSVKLTWTASTDNLAIGGYDVFRDGASLASVGAVLTYTDSTVLAGSTHIYQVRARDTAGNVSALSATVSATTPIPPDTIIDSGPLAGTASTGATFTFHSDQGTATFTCKLDTGTAATCTSPKAYTGLAQAVHTFSVFATLNGIPDPTPATATWTVDTTAPTAPTAVAASLLSPTSVQLTWVAATDNLGVTGYKVFRDGSTTPLATIGAVTTYTDSAVTAGTTPAYTVQAFDIAGNLSPLTAPVSPPPPVALDPRLTRMPYLTDLIGLNATVNFATDRSGVSASVKFGTPSGSTCSLTTTVPATRITISVNGIFEYQWKAALTLPATGSYCYRAYLGTVDLLGANAAPVFQTQVPLGSTAPFSFDVFGDWGQTDATGANPYQAGVMSQITKSGARFAITTGDQGYPSGGQNDFGDLQSQLAGIFGMPFWGGVGSALPIFPAIGNHGFARGDAIHPHFGNWPQDAAVASSGGRAQVDAYASVNGSNPANYPSSWYAFSAGNARFYVLTATWADLNIGTGSVYGNDYLAHWAATSPEYQWLQADLAAHPSGLKFAFFHYPLYSDQPSESGDTFLQGNSSLEGLLAGNGVNIAFNGHAHIYERNAAASGTGRQGLVSYVTGGGGGQAQSTGTCGTLDRYAVGWSYTNNLGTACGTALVPTSPAQVHHFLKVTINGSQVTVAPTDSTGRTFDVQTYTFNPRPDTFLDTTPPAGSNSTSAAFTFHASSASATYTCKLDAAVAAACTSPKSYTGLAQGSHTFSVYATVGGVADPLPATFTWTVDTSAPTAAGSFAASATSPFSVALSWTAATDNLAVTGYDVYRNGQFFRTIAPATAYADTDVLGSTNYSYQLRARDVAGNVSALTNAVPASVTTPPPPVPVFADGFESGDLIAWTTTSGLIVQQGAFHGGTNAAEGNTTAVGPYAKKTLPSTYADAYARVWFLVKSQTSQVNLLRMRDTTPTPLTPISSYVYIEDTGQLGFHNDATGTSTLSATIPSPGWHAVELHILPGASGAVDVWLDNVRIADLSGTGLNTGSNPIGAFQIGEAQTTSQVYDVVFDDAAFGTARLGPVADTPPSVPTGLTATATSPFSVNLTWTGSSDDLRIVGYDVFRGGVLVGSVGAATLAYSDTTALASTAYSYTVRARDTSNNPSAQSAPASATTPAAPAPVFADGFEAGDMTAWTTSAGLLVQGATVRNGSYAAQGVGPANARKTLPATYADTYTRVGFLVNAGGTQASLIRLRDAAGASVGYAFLSSTGRIGFRNDFLGINATSYTSLTGPSAGWHALELHLGVAGASSPMQVWLDGALVAGLPSTVDLGAAGAIGQFQIGDTVGGTNDIAYDDAAFGTARLGPTGDTVAPTVPANLSATPAPFSVPLNWDPSTDNVAVAGYDVYRGGTLLASLVTSTSYTDTTVLASTGYTYAVRAKDTSGNPSATTTALSVTTPAPLPPVFADGFESGDLSVWTTFSTSSTLAVRPGDVSSGLYAAEGNTSTGAFAKKTLGTTYTDAYARVGFEVKSLGANDVTLLRLRPAPLTSVGYVYVTTQGKLAFRADAATSGKASATTVGLGWHTVEMHLLVNGSSSTVEVWLDGILVSDLSSTGVNLGTNPVAGLQIGDTGGTYDIVFDDVAFGTTRLGPTPDSPPAAPATLAATTPSPYSVALTWATSSDDLGIAGYDVFREGSPLTSTTGVGTTFTDATAVPNTLYTYKVRARDTSGNRSAFSPDASATTPADNPPTVPTNLAWTAPSRTSVVLTWTASIDDVGVVGYDVWRDGAALVTLGNVTTYTDSTVTAGTTHTYAVLARDGFAHSSGLSASVSATTPLDSPPTVPGNVAASASTPYAVSVTWDVSTDPDGTVADYDVYREGVKIAGHVTALSYADVAVSGGATYAYTILARDNAGNVSALSTPPASVTLPAAPTPTFASGFEATDPAWTTNTLALESTTTHSGLVAAEASLTNAAGLSARKTLAGAPTDVYSRVWFYVKSQGTNATLLGFRSGGSLVASVYLGTNNKFGVIGLVSTTALPSATAPSQNAWHALEFHVSFGSSTTTQVWLDGVPVTDLSGTIVTTGITSTDTFQVGDTTTSLTRTYDIVYDDAAFGTSRLGQ